MGVVELLLVRHGESAGNVAAESGAKSIKRCRRPQEKRAPGSTLTRRGRRENPRVVRRSADIVFTRPASLRPGRVLRAVDAVALVSSLPAHPERRADDSPVGAHARQPPDFSLDGFLELQPLFYQATQLAGVWRLRALPGRGRNCSRAGRRRLLAIACWIRSWPLRPLTQVFASACSATQLSTFQRCARGRHDNTTGLAEGSYSFGVNACRDAANPDQRELWLRSTGALRHSRQSVGPTTPRVDLASPTAELGLWLMRAAAQCSASGGSTLGMAQVVVGAFPRRVGPEDGGGRGAESQGSADRLGAQARAKEGALVQGESGRHPAGCTGVHQWLRVGSTMPTRLPAHRLEVTAGTLTGRRSQAPLPAVCHPAPEGRKLRWR